MPEQAIVVAGLTFNIVPNCGEEFFFGDPIKNFRHCEECGKSELETPLYFNHKVLGDQCQCAGCLKKLSRNDLIDLAQLNQEDL